jgi:hypothetical protein
MGHDNYIGECSNILNKALNDYFNEKGSDLITLLKGIVVVEPSTATPDSIINQLKESYYPSELDSYHFVMGLYNHDKKTMAEYIDIISELVLTDEMDKDIDDISALIKRITPELEPVLTNKINQTIKL